MSGGQPGASRHIGGGGCWVAWGYARRRVLMARHFNSASLPTLVLGVWGGGGSRQGGCGGRLGERGEMELGRL
jgi:hypothetical protein